MSPEIPSIEKLIVDVAKEKGVKHIVKISAITAEKGNMAIGDWHIESESYLKKSGLQWTIIRPMPSMSFILSFADMIKNGGGLFVPAGEGKTGFIDADDVAEVSVASLLSDVHNGKIYVSQNAKKTNNHEKTSSPSDNNLCYDKCIRANYFFIFIIFPSKRRHICKWKSFSPISRFLGSKPNVELF
jgi:hypothetical protein